MTVAAGSAGAGATTFRGAEGNALAADVWGDEGPDAGTAVRRGARPVVLLHGGGQSRGAWRTTAAGLAAAGVPGVALDLRGHGESDWAPSGSYRLRDHVADLRRVLATRAAGGGGGMVVGASLGGLVALTLLAGDGTGGRRTAAGLVLVDVTARMERRGVQRVRDFMTASPDGFASLQEAAAAVGEYLEARHPSQSSGLRRNLALGADGRYRWRWDPRILDGMDDDPDVEPDALLAAAKAVRVPVLLLRGQRSDVVSEAGARELADVLAHAEVVVVAAAGHVVSGGENSPYAPAIADFAARGGA